MDITARVLDPIRQTLETFLRQSEGTFSQEAAGEGDYSACFDNTYSTFSSKQVYVEFSVSDPAGLSANYDYDDDYIGSEELREMRALDEGNVDEFQMTVDEIKESLTKIRAHVYRAQHDQDLFSVMYAKDFNSVNNTLSRCNFWAVVQLTLVLLTGLLQVFMVKGLFDEKYSFKKYVNVRGAAAMTS
jgi:protein ERP2